MQVHQLPRRPQNVVDAVLALSGVVYEIAEDHREALQCISLKIKALLGIDGDDLPKEDHPVFERGVKTLLDEHLVDSVSPADASEAEEENI